MNPKLHGFTLIELLIVVAIISILAAVAVPNFLEAQVRAKISKAMGDMNTIATGLEAYYVDNNHYPCAVAFNTTNQRVLFSTIFDDGAGTRFGHITTPIAYLSQLPRDPFSTFLSATASVKPGNQPFGYDKAGFGMVSPNSFPNGPFSVKGLGGFVVQLPDDIEENGMQANGRVSGAKEPRDEMLTPRRWVLWSTGPADEAYRFLTDTGASRYKVDWHYDPTNGTTSVGFLLRYQGGESFPAR